jgi:hypothetical protein
MTWKWKSAGASVTLGGRELRMAASQFALHMRRRRGEVRASLCRFSFPRLVLRACKGEGLWAWRCGSLDSRVHLLGLFRLFWDCRSQTCGRSQQCQSGKRKKTWVGLFLWMYAPFDANHTVRMKLAFWNWTAQFILGCRGGLRWMVEGGQIYPGRCVRHCIASYAHGVVDLEASQRWWSSTMHHLVRAVSSTWFCSEAWSQAATGVTGLRALVSAVP